MHRTRTRFAARVNRVATGLERRGIVATYRLHDRVLANRASRRRYAHESTELDESQQEVVDRLRKDGYATVPLTELVPDPEVWNELEAEAARFVTETQDGLALEQEGGESALRRRAGKEFLVRKYSWGVELGIDDPWLRLGANPRLLDLANAYLGMWSKLEYVDVWYTQPAGSDERLSSQRWHRDFNDRHLLKGFLYLVDVDEQAGPFEYVRAARPAASSRRSGHGVRSETTIRRRTSSRDRSTADRSRSPRRREHSSCATPQASTAAALRRRNPAPLRHSPGTRRLHSKRSPSGTTASFRTVRSC